MIQQGQIMAVGFGLDLTKRNTQSRLKEAGLPWERAKSFDGAAVFSEFVDVTYEQVGQLRLELHINADCRQNGGVEMMLYKPQAILDEISRFLSFEDGDIIMTGTPEGVGEVKAGDEFIGKVFLGDEPLVQGRWTAQ